MSAHISEAANRDARPADMPRLAALLLVRVAAPGGATCAEVVRDLAPLLAHRLSPGEWRREAEAAAGRLVATKLASETRGRLRLTAAGATLAAQYLGPKADLAKEWAWQRDVGLVAKALGLERESPAKLKALARPEGLRSLVVQKAFGLPLKKNQSPAKIRAQLALVALERAFGNKIKSGFGARTSLPAKASRLLAGQLCQTPRDFESDARLIGQLAAESCGAAQPEAEALRAALLRRLGTEALINGPAQPAGHPRPVADNDTGPVAHAKPSSLRPDLAQFSRAVKAAAAGRAEGWPGNRKAFISHVWQAIRDSKSDWGLTEIEFKCMLAEAHRAGAIMLANADLKDKKNIKDIESSAILYKNTVWHFVRVED